MEKNDNRGFSLIELIVVISILAILVGVLVPQVVKYIGRSKRTMDVYNAASFARACQTSVVFNSYAAPTEDEYYQGFSPTAEEAKGIWTCGFRAGDAGFTDSLDLENPDSFLEYFCSEIGCIPVSKTDKDLYWNVQYNRYTMQIVKISLIDGNTGTFYELYPDGKDFIKNGP